MFESVAKKNEAKLTPQMKMGVRALGEIQMAIRFHRLYPHDHPFCAKSTNTAFERLTQYLDKHGPLEIEVQREGLFIDDIPVMTETDQSTDLTNLLFPEGIRELSIEPDLARTELEELVVIMSAHYPEETGDQVSFGDDLLTALWRKDFKSFEYRIHDPLAATFVRNQRDTSSLATVKDRIRQIVDTLGGSLEDEQQHADQDQPGGLSSEAFISELEEKSEDLDDMATWATRPERVREFLQTDAGAERKKWLGELEDPIHADNLGRAAEVIVWSSSRRSAEVAPGDVARFLAGSTLHALSRGDLNRAVEMVGRATEADAGRSEIGTFVSQRLGKAESLDLLAKALESRSERSLGTKSLVDDGLRYLSQLDISAVEGTVELYEGIENLRIRRVFRRFLETRVDEGAESIAQLTRSGDEKVVRDAIAILAAGGQESPGWTHLQQTAKAKGTRGEMAQDVIDDLTGESERKQLVEVILTNANAMSRLNAISALIQTATRRTFDQLMPLIDSDALAERPPEEIQALFDLLDKVGQVRAQIAIKRVAGRKTPLLIGRAKIEKLKALAREWLTRRGQP